MKVLSIVGARPQFVKLGAIAREFATRPDIEHIIAHTGQHYDPALSDVFFRDLQIPSPDVHLEVGSGTHGVQTGAILARLDPVLADITPDWVLVYGDTNSTIAGALAAVKLHIRLAHLEAGLRSHNRLMPEEHNRVLTDHAADLLLAPTERAMCNLAREGLAERSVNVGDVMTDVCLRTQAAVARHDAQLPAGIDQNAAYAVATIHRQENTDNPDRLAAIIKALAGMQDPVALLAHPRLVNKAASQGLDLNQGAIRLAEPLPYPEMVRAVMGAARVITDSGGLQKEAFLLQTPCVTLRTETEWPETVEAGWNVLDPELSGLNRIDTLPAPPPVRSAPYGTGHAAVLVADALRTR